MSQEIIDGATGELIPYEAPSPATLFGTSDPSMVIERAQSHAKALVGVIRSQHLYKTIGNKNHVLVEAWTLLGSMLGVFPVVVWTRQLENGWEARVEARTLNGSVVGAAEAQCLNEERNWKGKDDYAIRSMAQTRATSKALRGPLGFIIVLAGYEATPAEEMPTPGANPSASGREEKPPTKEHWGAFGIAVKELDANPDKPPPKDSGCTTWEEYTKQYVKQVWGFDSRSEMNRGQLSHLMKHLEEGAPSF